MGKTIYDPAQDPSFRNPVIDFDRNDTYIRSEGINQDFGIYDSPDELRKEHGQSTLLFYERE